MVVTTTTEFNCWSRRRPDPPPMKVEAGMGGPSLMRKAIETASMLTFAKAAA
jgi:hypothetical protein